MINTAKGQKLLRWPISIVFLLESILVCLLFAAMAGGPTPDVNESHYWTKAYSFWDPTYCPDDLFLQSSDAHWVFYLTLGQLTRCFALSHSVWIARWIIWGAMSLGWTYLSRTFCRGFGTSILTAGLLVVLTRWFHLAGEWVVGGAEAKGLAFACIFVSIALATQRNWKGAWIWGGAASAFHVLVGGWLVLCMLVVWILDLMINAKAYHSPWYRSIMTQVPWLLGGALVSLLGLIPALSLSYGLDPEIANQGARIYAIDRISHHMAIWALNPFELLSFATLLVAWVMLLGPTYQCADQQWVSNGAWLPGEVERSEPGLREYHWAEPKLGSIKILTSLSIMSLVIAGCGAALGILILDSEFQWDQGIRWLRFYWFRTSDLMIPMSVAIMPFYCVYRSPLARRSQPTVARSGPSPVAATFKWGAAVCTTACLLISLEAANYWYQFYVDPRPIADRLSLPSDKDRQRTQDIYQNWKKVCVWIANNTSRDAMFLTPKNQQTFKWYAGRSEVVCWKDVPQDCESLVQWSLRTQDCFPHTASDLGFALEDPVQLAEVIRKYDVDYLLIPQYAYQLKDRVGNNLPYKLVYPESPDQKTTFVVLDTRRWQ